MQLSKHFKLEEFTKSMTATRKGIDNSPGAGDIKNLENVCYEILEPVRAKFDKPITVTSGYRSEELCEANRKQVLTYDGKSYENGLPDMAWKDGKVVG
jgi:zinc D-Ala-D-Ala carboxypeptidase